MVQGGYECNSTKALYSHSQEPGTVLYSQLHFLIHNLYYSKLIHLAFSFPKIYPLCSLSPYTLVRLAPIKSLITEIWSEVATTLEPGYRLQYITLMIIKQKK